MTASGTEPALYASLAGAAGSLTGCGTGHRINDRARRGLRICGKSEETTRAQQADGQQAKYDRLTRYA